MRERRSVDWVYVLEAPLFTEEAWAILEFCEREIAFIQAVHQSVTWQVELLGARYAEMLHEERQQWSRERAVKREAAEQGVQK